MAIRTKRWTRLECDRLIDLGVFRPDDRVELLGGHLLVREPPATPPSTAIRLVAPALRAAFEVGWIVAGQLPVSLDEESETEPDVTVVAGAARDFLAAHPSRPALIVGVAPSSLALDRGEKASAYARAGIEDYWTDAEAPYLWRYAAALTLERRDRLKPLAASADVLVADLLP